MKRYCLILDLQDDETLIKEYERWHENVWPEIIASIKESGITNMSIYRFGTRLVMIMETDGGFSFERKAALDAANAKVQEWENLMWNYQKQIPGTRAEEKWVLMDKIFEL